MYLTETITIGQSKYQPGTKVVANPVYSGTRHEGIWVVFPGGEATYLNKNQVTNRKGV